MSAATRVPPGMNWQEKISRLLYTESLYLLVAGCKNWCAGSDVEWSTKCVWRKLCGGCPQCGALCFSDTKKTDHILWCNLCWQFLPHRCKVVQLLKQLLQREGCRQLRPHLGPVVHWRRAVQLEMCRQLQPLLPQRCKAILQTDVTLGVLAMHKAGKINVPGILATRALNALASTTFCFVRSSPPDFILIFACSWCFPMFFVLVWNICSLLRVALL